jgi:hypothetical protein
MATPANKTEAILIYNHGSNTHSLRVYNPDFSFTDYDILHNDLAITINDPDAFFYDNPPRIDHSPSTLGLVGAKQTE